MESLNRLDEVQLIAFPVVWQRATAAVAVVVVFLFSYLSYLSYLGLFSSCNRRFIVIFLEKTIFFNFIGMPSSCEAREEIKAVRK